LAALTQVGSFAAVKSDSGDLLIADFNTRGKINTRRCTGSFDSAIRRGDSGYSLKIKYDVYSRSPVYSSVRIALPDIDASDYDNLSFWLKGNGKTGYSTVFKIELESSGGQAGYHYVTSVIDHWQEIVIPLSKFKGLTDISSLTALSVVFEDKIASNKRGVIYIDDLRFTMNK